MWDSLWLRLAVIMLLVSANAFFVAAEFALVAARRTRMDAMIRRGDLRARLARHSPDARLLGSRVSGGYRVEQRVAKKVDTAVGSTNHRSLRRAPLGSGRLPD